MSVEPNYSPAELKEAFKNFLNTAPEIYLSNVSIDPVIIGFHKKKLRVLLLRFFDTPYFALPGGYVKKQETLDDAALRNLQERTGLENIYLEQFYTFGDLHRSDEEIVKNFYQKTKIKLPVGNWFEQRFISVCYYALVDFTKVNTVTNNPVFTDLKWFDLKKLPRLLFDHKVTIEKALERLQADLEKKLVHFNLMKETFTMAELQQLHEAVFQKKFVRTNFQRKMLSLDVLERLEKKYNGKAHKAPYLYRLKGTKSK